MGILDEDIAAVRAASDIVAIVSQYTQLRRVGRRWEGLCPFHTERTPSFKVNAEEGFYHCFAAETRVLTWDGVREIRDLAGTTARILTEKGHWVEAPFHSFGIQPLMRLTLTRNRQKKVIYATPEHRWFVRGKGTHRCERTTENLLKGHALSWAFPRNRTRLLRELSPFGVAHGIAFGDGTRFDGSVCVDLFGEKNAQLLKWFPLNQTMAGAGPGKDSITRVLDLPLFFKDLPSLDEAPTYLAGWLAGYLAADGHVDKEGTCCLNSANRAHLEYVRMLCTRLGIGSYGITTQSRPGLPGREPSEIHRVHLIAEDLDERFFLIDEHRRRFASSQKAWTRRGWVVESVEASDRREEVFCAVVDGTHNFVLEDNILTGNCFGCQESGDVITFVREKEQLDFVGAVEWLAAKANVTLRYTDRDEGEGRKKRARLVKVMQQAVDWYHQRLLSGPDAGTARRYLRERGLDGDVVREFKIGWAPDTWDELCKALRLTPDDARDTGLGFVNSRNRLQDFFRARVLFPIADQQGDPVSFGGRILPGGESAGNKGKYKNTSETPLYQKSKILYGLDRAKAAVVSADTVVVCEGYTDVIGFHRNGVPLAVATCGTALTDEHVKLLRRYARHLVLAFDADGAGQAAAERFYQWEREHDLDVKVADLPAGRDPGDLAQSAPEMLPAAIEGARPFLRFRLDRAFGASDLSTPEGRAGAAETALALLAEHPAEMVRDQYLMDIGGRCRIEPERLRPQLDAFRSDPARAQAAIGRAQGRGDGGRSDGQSRRQASPGPGRGPGPGQGPSARGPSGPGARPGGGGGVNGGRRVEGPALEVLRHAVHNRAEVQRWLRPGILRNGIQRQVLDALLAAPSAGEARAAAPPDVAEVLGRLLVDEPQSEPFDAVRRQLTEVARAELSDLRLGAATAENPADVLAGSAFLGKSIDGLRDAEASVEAAERLLAWLAERVGDGG